MDITSKTETVAAELLAKLATEAGQAQVINITTPEGYDGVPAQVPAIWDAKTQKLSGVRGLLEDYRLRPQNKTGTANAETLAAFIDLTNRHKNESSAIFAKTMWPTPALTAVIDYHEKKEPAACRHRVKYVFPVTDELKAWMKMNGEGMSQAEFAEFLEEHAAELASPFDAEKAEYERLFKMRIAVPSDLMALARHLEVFVGAKVKQGTRLQTGERQIEFTEEHTNAKGEAVDIPGIFMIAVPAFLDGHPVRIPARLRYRLSGGGVTWFYQLYRAEFWLREQIRIDMAKAAEQTSLPAYEASPEISA